MSNPVLTTIDQRRSIRAYMPEQISKEQVDLLISAALSSPSANNAQPWHFTVVQNQGLLERINEAAVEEMKKIGDENLRARVEKPGYTIFYHAPTVIFISADASLRFAGLDCGIAVQTIALAAHSMGLGSVILGLPRLAFAGDKKEELEEALGFPEEHVFQIAIAAGHPAMGKEKPVVAEDKVHFIV